MNGLGSEPANYEGKNKGLRYFREEVEGGKKYTLPFEMIDFPDEITDKIIRKIQDVCKRHNTNKVIIRTSHRADWKGMVDTMPTEICSSTENEIKKTLDKIKQECRSMSIASYACREGVLDFDPNEITISFAPFIESTEDNPKFLITQHPTIGGAVCIDFSIPNIIDLDRTVSQIYRSFDVSDKERELEVYYDYTYGKKGRFINKIIKSLTINTWIKESGVLPPSEVFQIEGGFIEGDPKLFQIRHFSDRKEADFSLGRRRTEGIRHFGVTPKGGITLEVLRVRERENFIDFEAENPGVGYFLVVENSSRLLKITEHPGNMGAYYGHFSSFSFAHQSARFVQMALREKHGVASVYPITTFDNLQTGQIIRIIADGIKHKIEIL